MEAALSIPAQTQKLYFTQLQALHTKHFGSAFSSYEILTSHGSDRFIVRLISGKGTCVGIVNPHTEENRAFISFGRTFREIGLNVPEIFKVSPDEGSYLLEDLGDETLHLKVNSNWKTGTEEKIRLYKNVIDTLPRFQVEAAGRIDYSLCYQFGEFGEDNINYDINYFKERFLKVFCKQGTDESRLDNDLGLLKSRILELPRDFFLYRDFQSRNIMLKGGEPFYIDFQSGRRGALLYDIASLLYDAKADIPQSIREELLEYYLESAGKYCTLDKELYREYFWYFAMIRILQAMGAYGYLGIVKGKSRFLESIPYALKNIRFILDNKIGELNYLKELFSELKAPVAQKTI